MLKTRDQLETFQSFSLFTTVADSLNALEQGTLPLCTLVMSAVVDNKCESDYGF